MMYINCLMTALLFASIIFGGVPDEVKSAAQKYLNLFHDKKNLKKYGFNSDTQFSDFTLGEPFKLYALTPEEIIGLKSSFTELKKITPLYSYPIIKKGEIVWLVNIKNRKGIWGWRDAGYTAMCPQLMNILETWPKSKGYTLILIEASFKLYFHIPQVSNNNLTMMVPNPATLNNKGSVIKKESNKAKYVTLGNELDSLTKIAQRRIN